MYYLLLSNAHLYVHRLNVIFPHYLLVVFLCSSSLLSSFGSSSSPASQTLLNPVNYSPSIHNFCVLLLSHLFSLYHIITVLPPPFFPSFPLCAYIILSDLSSLDSSASSSLSISPLSIPPPSPPLHLPSIF